MAFDNWQPISSIDDDPSYAQLRPMWSSAAKIHVMDDQFLVIDAAMGYTGMTPDFVEGYCFKDAYSAEYAMDAMAQCWTNEEYYDIWEDLMWAFFPGNMGN